MLEFKLPAIGEGVVEGEIVRWLKQPGEPVAANEAIVEVMTDKATVEIPAPRASVVKEHKAVEGDICAVGQTIAILEESSGAAKPIAPVPSASTPSVSTVAVSSTPEVPAATTSSSNGGPVLATPAARALAREHGIDLGSLHSECGRITKSDVLKARDIEAVPRAVGAPAMSIAPAPATRRDVQPIENAPRAASIRPLEAVQTDEAIPFRGMRRKIAEGIFKSYSTAAHYTYVEQIDMTRLVQFRAQAKQAAETQGVKLNYLPFIVKAVIHGLKKFPIVNAELDDAGGRIILKKHYSIGVATATEQGLTVPVVHHADRLSILEIAREITRVSDAARAGTAARDELTGSTFTITSLGQIGGVLATPILNYPEVGILGVHAIRKTPIVNERDEIVIGHLMNLSVSLDHRLVDGFEGASFLQEVRRYLEDPTLLMLASI